MLKPAGAPLFKFAPSKRIILTKGNRGVISVQGEEPYRTGLGVPKGVLKKGKTLALIKPRHLPYTVKVKKEKLTDVVKLLQKHFGVDWREIESLNFYRRILDGNDDATVGEDNEYTCVYLRI